MSRELDIEVVKIKGNYFDFDTQVGKLDIFNIASRHPFALEPEFIIIGKGVPSRRVAKSDWQPYEPSTDIKAAMELAAEMNKAGLRVSMDIENGYAVVRLFGTDEELLADVTECHDNLNEALATAIAKAWLEWHEWKGQEK